MPKILIVDWLEFFIFSSDINESRRHMHLAARKGKNREIAKFWLEPKISVAEQGAFSDKEVVEIIKIISNNFDTLNLQLDVFFSGKKVETVRIK